MLYKLIALNGRFIHSCPALFYVRQALLDNLPDCQPKIVQYTVNDPYYPTLRHIGANAPDVLFFSVYIWNSTYIQRLATDLVKLLPGTPFIFGGPGAETMVGELHPEIRQRCTLVEGEIEGVDKAFYRDLAGKKLQREYGCRRAAAFRSPYREVDFTTLLKNRNVYYESSRGCPFSCTYCLSGAEKGVHHLPLSQVHDEVKDIVRHNSKVVRFVDRTFNDLPDRALAIWRFLAERPGKTLFHFEMAPDRFTPEMFRFLAQVGVGRFQFEIGVQSTNPQTLEAINRKCDPVMLATNIRKLVAMDTIHIHLDLILGLPHENRETFLQSFRDVFLLGPHYIQMGLLKVLPGTPLSRSSEEFGLTVCAGPPYEVMATKWLTAEEVDELFWFGECVEAFFNNRFFRSFWDYLRKAGEDIVVIFQTLLNLCRNRGFFDRAKTQELMSSLLTEVIQGRPDQELLLELLIFDWLRCGHHYMPDHLGTIPVSSQRQRLWKVMPLNWKGVYDYKGRDEFFRQGVFIKFSGNLLQETGLSADGQPAHVCFTPAREKTVFRHNRVVVIPAAVSGVP